MRDGSISACCGMVATHYVRAGKRAIRHPAPRFPPSPIRRARPPASSMASTPVDSLRPERAVGGARGGGLEMGQWRWRRGTVWVWVIWPRRARLPTKRPVSRPPPLPTSHPTHVGSGDLVGGRDESAGGVTVSIRSTRAIHFPTPYYRANSAGRRFRYRRLLSRRHSGLLLLRHAGRRLVPQRRNQGTASNAYRG